MSWFGEQPISGPSSGYGCQTPQQALRLRPIAERGISWPDRKSAKTAYAPSRLPRLECDHAAAPRGQGGDGGGVGSPRQSLVSPRRRSSRAPGGRGGERRHRGGGRCAATKRDFYVGGNRG